MNKEKVVVALNEALSLEYASLIQLVTNASYAEGMNAPILRDALHEMASEELEHAKQLLERLWVLGAKPTTQVGRIQVAKTPTAILDIQIAEEEMAVKAYSELLKKFPRTDVALYETIEAILEDSIRDLEKLRRLRGA
ncbi:MAG: ferritin-like domain-containing protein [Candidatus Bathyarchaeia archaeon]